MAKHGGIFCIEGQWSDDLRVKKTVKPLLSLYRSYCSDNESVRADYIHRTVATKEEFFHCLRWWVENGWSKKNDPRLDYPILYIASHGGYDWRKRTGIIWLTDDIYISLDEVANEIDKTIEEIQCETTKYGYLYFGSCGIMKMPEDKMQKFIEKACIWGVCGYSKNPDWIESAAFEVMLFANFFTYSVKTTKGLKAIERKVQKTAEEHFPKIGFKMVSCHNK